MFDQLSPRGVSPVRMLDSFGVSPVRNVPSKPPKPDGPKSIAGDRGPFRSDPKEDQPGTCDMLWLRTGLVRLDTPGSLLPSLAPVPLNERSNGFGSESWCLFSFVCELKESDLWTPFFVASLEGTLSGSPEVGLPLTAVSSAMGGSEFARPADDDV